VGPLAPRGWFPQEKFSFFATADGKTERTAYLVKNLRFVVPSRRNILKIYVVKNTKLGINDFLHWGLS
jgi:hypothetical protein